MMRTKVDSAWLVKGAADDRQLEAVAVDGAATSESQDRVNEDGRSLKALESEELVF